MGKYDNIVNLPPEDFADYKGKRFFIGDAHNKVKNKDEIEDTIDMDFLLSNKGE